MAGLLKKLLAGLFAAPASAPFYSVAVRCARCGEIIASQINLYNDLSVEYGPTGAATYVCRKVLIGQARCFQQIEVSLTFDADRRLAERRVTGGEFVDATPARTS
jgi:DNA-directed RNA polymerase subunit N (RpoN/RPB10)